MTESNYSPKDETQELTIPNAAQADRLHSLNMPGSEADISAWRRIRFEKERSQLKVEELSCENICLKAEKANLAVENVELKLKHIEQAADAESKNQALRNELHKLEIELARQSRRIEDLCEKNDLSCAQMEVLRGTLLSNLRDVTQIGNAKKGSLRTLSTKAKTSLYAAVFLRRFSPFVDGKWYNETYQDVKDAAINPTFHYVKFGWAEGRDPSPSFSTRFYLQHYPDVQKSEINPLLHYILNGKREGRCPHAIASGRNAT